VNASNRPMTLCGTDDWMAPEMIMGFQYDNKVDVFSYGIVLCELITRAKISDHLQRKPQEAFGLNVSQLEKLIPADCPPEFAQVAIGTPSPAARTHARTHALTARAHD